jgi:hypothetical protein
MFASSTQIVTSTSREMSVSSGVVGPAIAPSETRRYETAPSMSALTDASSRLSLTSSRAASNNQGRASHWRVNRAPGVVFSTTIWPPCCSVIALTMARPKPLPE